MSSHQEEREEERARVGEWLDSLQALHDELGPDAAERVVRRIVARAASLGVAPGLDRGVVCRNDAGPAEDPGNAALERRVEGIVRWNAMAMVGRANRAHPGLGGHLSSYASAATMMEVGFQHFFRGPDHPEGADVVFLQGHASPGVYARAFVEGRLGEDELERFRREVGGAGLSSYPHPWLMPRFWTRPSVSMGLAPNMAVQQARFHRYAERRGIASRAGRVWALIGDGEMDEPESLGALPRAGRYGLSNLVFLVDCNLQRLDGPVRGAGKIIEELRRVFRGAGWAVFRCLWGSGWDELFAADTDGLLTERLDALCDAELQRAHGDGATLRAILLEGAPELEALLGDWSDRDLGRLERGGHDRRKVYEAMRAAEAAEQPAVVLAQTVKGYGLGSVAASNVSHKAKILELEDLRALRERFDLPLGDDELEDLPFLRLGEAERAYVTDRRRALGGPVPRRAVAIEPLPSPPRSVFERFEGAIEREATTTMIAVRLLGELLASEGLGERIVPIVPDEARTFGLEALFPKVQIHGEPFESVDADRMLSYDVARDGQILEEGIDEAGAMGSFIAAGTAHESLGEHALPFFFFYSMFGFQRIGDLIWAAQDSRAKGFLIGATSGRTTLNGEGLQHQDGQSQLFALASPAVHAYDPAFAYEIAVIVEHGIERMVGRGQERIVYLTVANEPYAHPAMPPGARDDILRGMHRCSPATKAGEVRRAQILASGPAMVAALEAQQLLEDEFGVTTDVWSVSSWKALYEDGVEADRRARLRPERAPVPFVREQLGDDPGAVVAVTDHVKALPLAAIGRWVDVDVLGTDGFGRSDTRETLRDFFEVDARHVALAVLRRLARDGRYPEGRLESALETLAIDIERPSALFNERTDPWVDH